MSIPPEGLQLGQCYLGTNGRVHRVTRIMPDGRIQYEHRGAKVILKTWKSGMVDGRSFTAMVKRPVPCDWTPETDT
jgi:hypothetical protein